jgi:flagellin-like protein
MKGDRRTPHSFIHNISELAALWAQACGVPLKDSGQKGDKFLTCHEQGYKAAGTKSFMQAMSAGGQNMKKIWRKDGVSPVIATILMVAITVVLAAVLYVMVIQLGGGPPDNPPAYSWYSVDATSRTEGKMVFGQFSYEVRPLDIEVRIKANGSEIGSLTIPTNDGAPPQNVSWSGAPNGASAIYYDYRATGGSVNQGDYIELSGLSPGTMYSFEVFHNPTESIATLTSSTDSFTTP